ncbi:hypothetical protein [Hymenobacter persicinus]|uniref:Uncharacterized protein n=1 Tax=Hymenobacter persicinus TaxID=2025506 RepID=A0A4Q5L9C9_9BACT|nr:hypothetical protein [Hymenobacter persicinus]RYU78111.1 hypothetical protein EWM57_15405 [Hymenobacter persicinus]
MKKTKKTKTKAKAGKKSLLGGAAKSLRKLGKGSGLSKLSTTQKVVGGTALVALGLSYLATRPKNAGRATATPDAAAAEQNLTALEPNDM